MAEPSTDAKLLAVVAAEVAPRKKSSGYPGPFRSRVAGRVKRVWATASA